MRAVDLAEPVLDAVRRHAREAYPDECCGFLIALPDGPDSADPRRIVAADRAPNEYEGERRRRFVIRPAELTAAEERWDGTGRVVAGFYHSHPDHPARPSAFDEEHAWPWYTYLVAAVTPDAVPALGAFELDPDSRRFRDVPFRSGSTDAGVTKDLRAVGAR
jgi:proteasome lid subunit RPN8/RPN11